MDGSLYLEQFHPRYNPDAECVDFEDAAFNFNTELPVMYAWKVAEIEDEHYVDCHLSEDLTLAAV